MKKWFVLFSLVVAVAAQAGDVVNYAPAPEIAAARAKKAAAEAEAKRRSIKVGMTIEQALERWGVPNKVNNTTRASGVFSQWVYGSGRYLHFDNGTLISIVEEK